MEGYKWKLAGLGKGVDVALVVEELTRLQKVSRILTPEVVSAVYGFATGKPLCKLISYHRPTAAVTALVFEKS